MTRDQESHYILSIKTNQKSVQKAEPGYIEFTESAYTSLTSSICMRICYDSTV